MWLVVVYSYTSNHTATENLCCGSHGDIKLACVGATGIRQVCSESGTSAQLVADSVLIRAGRNMITAQAFEGVNLGGVFSNYATKTFGMSISKVGTGFQVFRCDCTPRG